MMHPKLVYNFKTGILKIEPGHHQTLSFDKDSIPKLFKPIDSPKGLLKIAQDVFCELNKMEMLNQLRSVNSIDYPDFNKENNIYEITVTGEIGNNFEKDKQKINDNDIIIKHANIVKVKFENEIYGNVEKATGVDDLQAAKDVSHVLHNMTMSNQLRAVNSYQYPSFNTESNMYEIVVKGDKGSRFEEEKQIINSNDVIIKNSHTVKINFEDVINDGKVEYALYTGGPTDNSKLIQNPTNNNPYEKFVYILNDECYVLRIDCLYYRSDGEFRLTTNYEFDKLIEEYISTYKISKENVKITTSTFVLDVYIIYQTTYILEPDYCYLHLYKINKNDLIEFENWKKRCSAIK